MSDEPKTMARVQGVVEERWPHARGYTVWVDQKGRHVAVRFSKNVTFEGIADTWLEAMEQIDRQRKMGK